MDALRDVAETLNNQALVGALGGKELEKIVVSAWSYEISGSNWVGSEQRLQTRKSAIVACAAHRHGADAMLLDHILRLQHFGHASFPASSAALSEKKIIPTWGRDRYRHALAALVEIGILRVVKKGGRRAGDPRLYAFTGDPPA